MEDTGEKEVTKETELEELGMQEAGDAELSEAEAALAKRKANIDAAEADLADRERLAGVRKMQLEVDARENALKATDAMIGHSEAGTNAKPGEAFIDKDGIQHLGSCNSHPSKRARYKCDCGRNGTSRIR